MLVLLDAPITRRPPPVIIKATPKEQWEAIHAIADRLTPQAGNQFRSAIEQLRGRIHLDDLAAALASGSVSRVLLTVPEQTAADLIGPLSIAREAFIAAGKMAAKNLAGNLRIAVSMDLLNPAAVQWASTLSSQLITNVTSGTREAVRDIITRAFTEKLPPRDAAKLIHEIVGLNARQAQAVANLQAGLAGQGVKPDRIEQLTARYAARLRRQRAMTIARHEILQSANGGQQALWQDSLNEGLLVNERTRRKWIITPDDRLCPICAQMVGDKAITTVNAPFNTPRGEVMIPQQIHTQCRCAMGLIIEAPPKAPKVPKPKPVPPPVAVAPTAPEPPPSVPAAPPAALQEGTPEWFDDLLTRRRGQPLGTNAGGIFDDASGERWYVKLYTDPRQAWTEQIANEIYRRLGIDVPRSIVGATTAGQTVFASAWIRDAIGTVGQVGLTPEIAREILKGFAADVLLANWDAVGLGLDNVVVTRAGKVYRVDQGGALLFRAQGGLKPGAGLGQIAEWETFLALNPDYRKVFEVAGFTSADALGELALGQIAAIEKLRADFVNWKKFVDQLGVPADLRGLSSDASLRHAVATMLGARSALLRVKASELVAGLAPGEEGADLPYWEFKGKEPRWHVQFVELVRELEERARRWRETLAPEAVEAVRDYTGNLYAVLNHDLRASASGQLPSTSEWYKLHTDLMGALGPATLPRPITVWRGVGMRGERLLEYVRTFQGRIGEIVTHAGHVSTTISPGIAASFGDVVLEIRTNRGAYVEPISHNKGELEVLLPHGTRFRIVGVRHHVPFKLSGDSGTFTWKTVIQLEAID